jgi:polysaccharide biosynthesis protein VpsJ
LKAFDATAIADRLLDQCRNENYAGYDPFDGLNSKLFNHFGKHDSSIGRVLWLQFHKRSLLNFRPLIAVRKERNPKGIALILLGLLERQRYLGKDAELSEAVELGDWLLANSVDRKDWHHRAWGYHFDWAARAFYVPRGKPNAITTCYVARALYALGEATGLQRFTDAAVDSGFFLDSLYVDDGQLKYYAYIPGETAYVHNASLWTAALVAKAAAHTGDDAMRARALRVTHQSVSMQRPDGSWVYGTRGHHGFIDGFHSGYNLEALTHIQNAASTLEFQQSIDRGMSFYRSHFFLPDGTVKYYNDRTWPLDTHSCAQAIITLIKVGDTPGDRSICRKVLNRAFETLYMPNRERFAYQRGRWLTNRINYLRWTQAWAFYALSLFAADDSKIRERA